MAPTASIETANLCGDSACRGRGMQVKLGFWMSVCNPLRRSCISRARKTLCGDRACRGHGMRVKLCFQGGRAQSSLEVVPVRSPLRTARNAGKVAFLAVPAQPSADITRVSKARTAGKVAFFFCILGRLRAQMPHAQNVPGRVCG